jgi:hypothetical protein
LGDLVEISMGGMVWSAREWWYGHVALLKVREDRLAGVCSVGLTRFKLWAGKIWGSDFPHSVLTALFVDVEDVQVGTS